MSVWDQEQTLSTADRFAVDHRFDIFCPANMKRRQRNAGPFSLEKERGAGTLCIGQMTLRAHQPRIDQGPRRVLSQWGEATINEMSVIGGRRRNYRV